MAGNKKTNGDLFDAYVRRYLPKPKEPPSAEEMYLSFYRFKLLDIFWFDDHVPVPVNPEIEFIYYSNNDWPNPLIHLMDTSGVYRLNEGELIFLCDRLKRPSWVKRAPWCKSSYKRFAEDWHKFPDVKNESK